MTLPKDADGPVKATDYLEGHVNCRCTLVPRAKSYAEILGDPGLPDTRIPIKRGESEFAALDTNTQAAILGPGKYELYRAGAPLDAFSQRHLSDAWGASRVARPLKDIMARLESGGWQPGDAFPPDLYDEYQRLAGPSGGFTPRTLAPIQQPTPVPTGKEPGDFETIDDVKEWWMREFPDIQLHFDAEVDMDAVNGTMHGLKLMKQRQPEGFKQLKAVRFHDKDMNNAYAHVAGAKLDPATGQWVSNGYSSSTSREGAVMEFNTGGTGLWYGKKTVGGWHAWTPDEVARNKSTYDAFKSTLKRFKFNAADARLKGYNSIDELLDRGDWTDIMRFVETPANYNWYTWNSQVKRYIEARGKVNSSGVQLPGDDPLWRNLQSDMRTGYHPQVGNLSPTDELTRAEQMDLIASVAIHEYGHVYDINVLRRMEEYAVDAITYTIGSDMRWSSIWYDVIKKPMAGGAVSNYAKKNEFEKFAEVWMSINMTPRSQWKPFTKRIARALEVIEKGTRHTSPTLMPYGNSIDTVIARWKAFAMQGKLNKEFGTKVFDVPAEQVKAAPAVLKLLETAKREGWSPSTVSDAIDKIVYGR